MAGTRGMNTLRGAQLRNKTLRDNHFDENFKINENKIDIQWHNHREILEDTKIDVFVQANNQTVSNLDSLDVTTTIGATSVSTDVNTEGIVEGARVELRLTGTQDTPVADVDGDPIYGKMRYDSIGSKFYVDFYSLVGGIEETYAFGSDAGNVDIVYIQRTNMSVIPVDAIVNGGAGFVEGATDAKAYMNLVQLMKDIYGGSGTLDNDGNANLGTSISQQIVDEIQNRIDADQAIRDDLASNDVGKGAGFIGVVADPNHNGLTVQSAITDLAQRMVDVETQLGTEIVDTHTRDVETANGYFQEKTQVNNGEFSSLEDRLIDIENISDAQFKNFEDRVTVIETEDEREVFEAAGGETGYMLQNGLARPNTLFLSINGSIQVPGLHYQEVLNVDGNVTGVTFVPDTLAIENGVPDNIFVWYKKVLS